MILLACVAGALAGAVSGLLPGLHVNTLAALLLAAGGIPGLAPAPVAVALLSAGVAAAFTGLACGTFLGAPPEDAVGAALPGHALLLEGRGVEACDHAATGALVGALLAIAAAIPLRLLLDEPVLLHARIQESLALILLGVALWLLASERRRIPHRRVLEYDAFARRFVRGRLARVRPTGALVLEDGRRIEDPAGLSDACVGDLVDVPVRRAWRNGRASRILGILLGASVFLLAGAYGHAALGLGARSPLGFPASPLLPMFTGLFGVPGLLMLLARRGGVPPQHLLPAPPPEDTLRSGAAGGFASVLLALLPGMSAAHAATFAMAKGSESREHALVTLGACAGGGACFSLLALPLLGRARTGAAVASDALAPMAPWTDVLPGHSHLPLLVALLVGACVGWLATRIAARGLARVANRLRADVLAGAALVLVLGVTWALAGRAGLGVLAAGCMIGLLPIRLGVRRSHCMGAILLPVLWRVWG